MDSVDDARINLSTHEPMSAGLREKSDSHGQGSSVVVTGALGFIGVHLVQRLISEGFTVIGIDDWSSPSPRAGELIALDDFHLVEGDITDPASLNAAYRLFRSDPVAIFHLACPASPRDYLGHPVKTLLTSSEGTKNVAEIAAKSGACVVFTSTSEVYGDPSVHPQPESYWGNVNPNGPRSVYDEGKRYAEALLTAYAQSGLDIRIARLFNCYGPGMRPNDGRLVPTLMQALIGGNPMTIHGDGTQMRSLCYVSDTVGGLMALWRHGDGAPVNLGRAEELTITEICQRAARVVGAELAVEYAPLPTDDPRRRCPGLTRARSLLAWQSETPFETGVERTYAWFRSSLVNVADGW